MEFNTNIASVVERPDLNPNYASDKSSFSLQISVILRFKIPVNI